jgi:3-hydroxyacyl-[acyl-carrier-protein] dehydratase
MKLLNSFFNILSENDDDIGNHVVSIKLNPEHVIYQAHFPGKPVTPGVCIIAMVTEVLEQWKQLKLNLTLVKNLKFVGIVSPLECECVEIVYQNVEETTDSLKAKGILRNGNDILTKFSMIYKTEQ